MNTIYGLTESEAQARRKQGLGNFLRHRKRLF
jgi:hypothetical protein